VIRTDPATRGGGGARRLPRAGGPVHPARVSPSADVARFAPGDPEAVVAASFACPLCLGVDCDVLVHAAPGCSQATCSCRRCPGDWTVALDPAQLLRLTVAPPADAPEGHVALQAGASRGFPWSA
jgi:hypothetical protein